MARRIAAFCMLVCLIVSLSACDAEGVGDFITSAPLPEETATPSPGLVVPSGPARQGIFGVAFSVDAPLSPYSGESRLNSTISPLLYESLFAVNGNFEAVPFLCSQFEQNGVEYRLTIRRGVTFSDGSPLTAADVKYSLDTARAAGSPYASRFAYVQGVDAPSDHEVRIRLTREIGRFTQLLDIPIVKNKTAGDDPPIGTGPYVYEAAGTSHYLTARSGYWRNVPMPLERIELIDTPEADMLIYSFETGSISLAANDPLATDPIGFGGDYEMWNYPTTHLLFLGFQTGRAPFNDAQIRRALSLAVDRESLVADVFLHSADAAVLPVNPASNLYDSALAAEYGHSLEKFSELLNEADVTDGDSDGILEYRTGNSRRMFQVELIVPAENRFKVEAAERIAENLRVSGIDVVLRELKWDAYLTALQAGDFDMYLGEVKLQDDFDIARLFASGGALSYCGYGSGDFQELHSAFLAADDASAEAAANDLHRLLLDDAPFVTLAFKRLSVIGRRGVVSGIAPVENNIFWEFESWTVKR